VLQPPLRSCRREDFMAEPFWEGHWVRLPGELASFTTWPDWSDARTAEPCPAGACSGSPRATLSLPWAFRLRSCHFHLFSVAEARSCLNGSWIWSSGDSNFPDTERNLLEDVLRVDIEGWMWPGDGVLYGRTNDITGWRAPPRAPEGSPPWSPFSTWLADSFSSNFSFRIGQVFNGALQDNGNKEGISVVSSAAWRSKNEAMMSADGAAGKGPDVLFINTGMHDGFRFSEYEAALRDFALLLRSAVLPFWDQLGDWASGGSSSSCRPVRIWRHTVTPAASYRTSSGPNPQKTELMNRLVAGTLLEAEELLQQQGQEGEAEGREQKEKEKKKEKKKKEEEEAQPQQRCSRPFHSRSRQWRFLDMFALSFPWHFDESVTDSLHYGRWNCAGCDIVDRWQVHVLLNGLCPLPE
jgi:hypothetical protein